MASDPPIEEQLTLAETRRRDHAALAPREIRAELLVAVMFAAAVGGLWLIAPPRMVHWGVAGACVALAALAIRVRFETPYGFTVATQLAFVPLAFTVPAALLPLAFMLALVLSRLPEMVRGRVAWSRLIYAPSNSCFALGPAWVFVIAGPARSAGALILILALAAQFAADLATSTLLVTAIEGIKVRVQAHVAWWVWTIDGALSAAGLVVAEQTRHAPFALAAILPLLGLLAMFARERAGRLEKLIELNETYRGTALLLGDVVEADDAYTGMHSQGVVALALAVGDALEIDAEARRDLEFGALLHDVGKIAIPKEIINKPGKLDPDEWEIVKTHAEEGQRMLARVGGFMTRVGEIVRSHHERWDGGGYPDRLLADAAPLEARIITCCDSWSAMRTDRPYRRALSHAAAVDEMRRNSGTQFDPRVAAALLGVVADHEPTEVAVTAATRALVRSA